MATKTSQYPNPDSVHNVAAIRQMFPFGGYIEDCGHRTVTVNELRRLVAYAQTRCLHWWDSSPKDVSKSAGQLLTMELMNFYHLNTWLVKPATKEHRCAFAELLGGKKASWMVSHAWLQRVAPCTATLERHARLRTASAYWLSLFAHRQHESKDARDIEAGMMQAISSCGSFLLCLDDTGSACQRSWCHLELWLAMDAQMDVAVVAESSGKVSVLTDGLAESDWWESGVVVSEERAIERMDERNKDFPVQVLSPYFDLEVSTSCASSDEDQRYILERLASSASELRGRVMQLCWRHSEERRTELLLQSSSLRLDLRRSQPELFLGEALRKVQLNLSYCEGFSVEELVERLPRGLQSLELDLRHSATQLSLAPFKGQELRHLSLRLGPEPSLLGLPDSLSSLRLHFLGASDASLHFRVPGELKSLVLQVEGVVSDLAMDNFLESLPILESFSLSVPCARCLWRAPLRAARKLRLRLAKSGADLQDCLTCLAKALPATLEELQLEVEDPVSKSAIATLAAHCPPSLRKVEVMIGEHRIQSPEELAQWSSFEADENQVE